jgi:hypothetical protein
MITELEVMFDGTARDFNLVTCRMSPKRQHQVVKWRPVEFVAVAAKRFMML